MQLDHPHQINLHDKIQHVNSYTICSGDFQFPRKKRLQIFCSICKRLNLRDKAKNPVDFESTDFLA